MADTEGRREAAFRDAPAERLFARYGAPVYRLAIRITGRDEDAAAVTGDILSAAAERTGMVDGESALGGWIYRTAARAAYERARARQPRPEAIALDDLLPSLGDGGHFGPMNDWSSRVEDDRSPDDLRGILTDALDSLPADYRTALVLHDVEAMPNPDIAETLGISAAGVKSLVHRSRLFVRKRLAEHLSPR